MRFATTLLLVSACAASLSVLAQPGALNPSFGIGGIAYPTVGASDESDEPKAIAVQPDGRIVVAGYVFPQSQLSFGFVARYMADGSADASFGSGGVTLINPTGTLQIQCIALQPDGKIVLGGAKGTAVSTVTQEAWFGRLNVDGTVDTGFGNNGERVFALSTNTDYVYGVAVAQDGGIYGLVYSGPPSNAPACMIRLTANGQPDAAFNGNGIRCNLFGGSSGITVGGLAVRSDGAAIGAGRFSFGKAAALLPNGQVDAGFGTSGVAEVPPGTDAGRFASLRIRPDGRILVAGWRTGSAPLQMHFGQLLPNGSPDPSFGTNGFAAFTPQGYHLATWMSPALLYPDGRFMVSWGRMDVGAGELDLAVSWFNADGSPHTVGTVITDLSTNDSDQDNAIDLAMAPDGDLLAVATTVDNFRRMVLLRYIGDLTSDVPDFSTADAGLRLFPNPADESLVLQWSGGRSMESVSVIDAAGRRVQQESSRIASGAVIDCSGLPEGAYVLEARVGDAQARERFVIAR
jgi:uncharacterized delta-60 repeat protein